MTPRSRSFTFDYQVTVPAHDAALELWLPVPRSDAYQRVSVASFSAPVELARHEEPVDHNHILYGRLPPTRSDQAVGVRYQVERLARRAPPSDGSPEPAAVGEAELSRFLRADTRVPTDGPVVEAAQLIPRELPALDRARRIFDNLLATLAYDGRGCTLDRDHELGDLVVACDLRRGTCTDFHGLYVAHARSLGLPARFAFGFNVPAKPEGRIAGYHCWAEVFVAGHGWLAVDVSEAWKRADPDERSFYFGNLDANRVQFTTGRDVELEPRPRTGPLDRFIFPLAETDGERVEVVLELAFATT